MLPGALWGLGVLVALAALTARAADAQACTPRPPIAVTTHPGGQVTIQAQTALSHVELRAAPNVIAYEPSGTPRGVPTTLAPTPGATAYSFSIRALQPGPVTLPIVVHDACGPWDSLVGAGTGQPIPTALATVTPFPTLTSTVPPVPTRTPTPFPPPPATTC